MEVVIIFIVLTILYYDNFFFFFFPVRGEYTMAPKLRTEAGLGADCGVLTHTAVQEPLASGAAPSTPEPRSPPRPRRSRASTPGLC